MVTHTDPIILTRDAHITDIMSRWHQNRVDEDTADVLFDAQLRAVAHSMYEPEPRRVDWRVAWDIAGALAFNFGAIGLVGLVCWQMIR
jgi:hypothetical protein